MEDVLLMVVLVLGAFVWGVAYGRMKGQQAEDELRIKIADLTQQVRILNKRLDAE